MVKKYKTIVLSDIHIGSRWSHTEEAMEFLRTNSCETLILNGDIIDGWHLMRDRNNWKQLYNDFLKLLIDIYASSEIIYLRGNHDDFLDNVVPFQYGSFSILRDYTFESHGKRFYVFHGDLFDTVTTKVRWMSKLGDKLYSMVLQINRIYNDYRQREGKDYFSISKPMKDWVKRNVSSISNFDRNILRVAKRHNCNAVICGHIHQAEIRSIKDVLYLNSGDWIESLTALTEDFDGNWTIVKTPRHKKI
ncbi:MAG: UDP-2,3-diacylglucosamine diphosphatase [Rikenellaceae bacterium]